MASGFITVRVPVEGYSPAPWYAVAVGAPVVVKVEPRPRRLVGWKALQEVSAEHGGPSSRAALWELCRARNAPVYVYNGMAVVADEQQFVWWLSSLRVPIALDALDVKRRRRRAGRNKPRGNGTKR